MVKGKGENYEWVANAIGLPMPRWSNLPFMQDIDAVRTRDNGRGSGIFSKKEGTQEVAALCYFFGI